MIGARRSLHRAEKQLTQVQGDANPPRTHTRGAAVISGWWRPTRGVAWGWERQRGGDRAFRSPPRSLRVDYLGELDDVFRRGALLALHHVELDAIAFGE